MSLFETYPASDRIQCAADKYFHSGFELETARGSSKLGKELGVCDGFRDNEKLGPMHEGSSKVSKRDPNSDLQSKTEINRIVFYCAMKYTSSKND